MSIFQTGEGYRAPSKAMTLKALQERQKAAAAATVQSMAPSETPMISPLQGLSKVFGTATAAMQESQAASAEAEGRSQLAQIMAQIDPNTGPTQAQLAQMQQLDPEFANRQYEAAMEERRRAAAQEDQQAFTAGESALTRQQQTTLQEGQQEFTAGQQEDTQAFTAGQQEDTQAATAAQNDLTRQADMARQKMQEAAADGRQEDQQAAAQELARLNALLDEQKAKTAQTIKTGAIGEESAAKVAEAERLGLKPGTPEYQKLVFDISPSAATNITTNVGGGKKLDETLDVEEGKIWTGHQKERNIAAGSQKDMAMLSELAKMAPQGPIVGTLMSLPILKNFSNAGVAFSSIVKRVAPTLRVEGSGSTSDLEYEGMLASLPALPNNPEANQLIIGMMQAKAQINIERGNVVDAYRNGEITDIQARQKLAEINSRSISNPELEALFAQIGGGGGEAATTEPPAAGAPDIDEIIRKSQEP